jgi:hypothetical protein
MLQQQGRILVNLGAIRYLADEIDCRHHAAETALPVCISIFPILIERIVEFFV